MNRLLNALLFIGGIAFGTIFSAIIVSAWTGPSQAAPNGNVSAPINVGATSQIKNGILGVNGLAVYGDTILDGPNSYLSFGVTAGATGYGIRDNSGTIEFKNSGSNWYNFFTTVQNYLSLGVTSIKYTDGSLLTCAGGAEGTIRYNATTKKIEFCTGTAWQTLAIVSNVFSATLSIQVTTTNFDASSAATAAGWDGVSPVSLTITVSTGAVVGSNSAASPAMTIDAFPTGSSITLINNGTVVGAGGQGGQFVYANNAQSGGSGGTALKILTTTKITNNGIIGGGGGGGAGGSRCYGGPGGGGGGAGYVVAAGGVGQADYGSTGTNGAAGNTSTGGAAGVSYGLSMQPGVGGGLGAAGGNSGNNAPCQAGSYWWIQLGGTAGNAVDGNSYVTWTALGTVYGSKI